MDTLLQLLSYIFYGICVIAVLLAILFFIYFPIRDYIDKEKSYKGMKHWNEMEGLDDVQQHWTKNLSRKQKLYQYWYPKVMISVLWIIFYLLILVLLGFTVKGILDGTLS